ncbi:MAG: hypothetical protein IPO30_19890 [Hyphomonadaceae bacterium]|nr:hypothetical protein [Hyphomonadaceae bacterium]MBP9233373.1 hypothetical protein [Hyphomonadaceae bacterium]
MHLIEILLPVTQSSDVRREVESLGKLFTDKFGGLTAFVRSPGEGMWADKGAVERDDVVVLEVMTQELDREWWREVRIGLQDRLNQKEIIVRAHVIDKL